jgi:hypothetical protein
MHPIHEFGTDAQKEKFLPRLATGELIGAFVRVFLSSCRRVFMPVRG